MRRALLLSFILVMPFISGCMVELKHDPEMTLLCDVAELNGWELDGARPTRDVEKQIGEITYKFNVFDKGSGNKARWAAPFGHPNGDNETVGPIQGVYWVELFGVGNAPEGNYGPINQRSLIYDPSEAVLTINGAAFHALPRAWRGLSHPGREVSVPVDLDARKNKDLEMSVFIAFPTKPPSKKDEYALSPGSIVLDGTRVPLPVFKSCHYDGKTYWQGIR
jgi:hypothetical protein